MQTFEKCLCIDCRQLDFEDRPFKDSVQYNLTHNCDSAEAYCKQWIKVHRKSNKVEGNTYFCTLTTPPGYNDYQSWLNAIDRVLKRKFIKKFTISAEHIKTNLHAHILIDSTKQVQKRDFHTYCKATGASIIDVKKVSENNGIEDYMKIENPSFTNFSEFSNFILNYINGLS